MLLNYDYSYTKKGKFIFVQSEDARRKGERLIDDIISKIDFPDNFYHYQKGGHVAALHKHVENKFFFRIDLESFFYSIGRNRVAANLHRAFVAKARTYAKWSCVKSPFSGGPRYALPIGFVQSPALASIALMQSPIMKVIQEAANVGCFVSVYMDDLIGSATELDVLRRVYGEILTACDEAGFRISAPKLIPPSTTITAFNCELRTNFVRVTPERIAKFFAEPQTTSAAVAFRQYCAVVARP